MNDSDTLIRREHQNTLRTLNNKKDSAKCCLQEIHFKYKDKDRLKVKGWKNCAMLALIERKLE